MPDALIALRAAPLAACTSPDFPADARSPASSARLSQLERECHRMMEVRLAGRMSERPVRERACAIFDYHREAQRQRHAQKFREPLKAYHGVEFQVSST